MSDLDWNLSECCNEDQQVTLALIFLNIVIIALFWSARMWITVCCRAHIPCCHQQHGNQLMFNPIRVDYILLPFKLITVFLHELGHATACWLTCGKVIGIEVNLDQGGVTLMQGGIGIITLPAGYLGSSFWGGFFIIMASAGPLELRIAAGMLCAALILVMIFLARNLLLRGLCLWFLVMIAALWVTDELLPVPDRWGLRIIMLFVGVMSSTYSVADVYDDLVKRKVNQSDASQFAKLFPGTSSRCWGVLWGILSAVFFAGSIFIALVVTPNEYAPCADCGDREIAIAIGLIAAFFAIGTALSWYLKETPEGQKTSAQPAQGYGRR